MSENGHPVEVHITFLNTEATDPLKKYATEKITHTIKKFSHHNTDAHVVLKVEKNRQIAEVSFRTDGADFHAKEESGDMYASIDTLVDSLTHQLRKHKDKITSHHKGS